MFFYNLESLCLSRNIKITQLLNTLNLSKSAISRWRSGTLPNGETLIQIADYFNCSLDFLVGRTITPTKQNTISSKQETLTEQELTVISAYRQNPNMQGAVNKLLGIQQQPMRAIKIARSNTSKVTEITGDFSDLFNAPRVLSDDDI